MSRILSAHGLIARIALNTFLLLCTVEIVAAVLLFLLPSEDPQSRYEQLEYYRSKPWSEMFWGERLDAEARVQYQPYTLWRTAPFLGTHVNINSSGLRETPGSECAGKACRVAVFGGSAVWGYHVPDWGTIPAYLHRELQARGHNACVLNFGENAWCSTQEVISLMRLLQAGRIPDVVIFYDGLNDAGASFQTREPGVHYMRDRIAEKLERKTRTYDSC